MLKMNFTTTTGNTLDCVNGGGWAEGVGWKAGAVGEPKAGYQTIQMQTAV